jgi:hypothetical protein
MQIGFQYPRLSLCILLLLSGISGRATAQNVEESTKAYVAHATLIDCPTAWGKKLIPSWTINGSNVITATLSDADMEKLCSSPQVLISGFPVIYLNAGERAKIDQQKPCTYPSTYSANGRPTIFATRGVGRLIEIDLKAVTNGMAMFAYHFEDVASAAWIAYDTIDILKSYDTTVYSRKINPPIFHSRSMSADTTLALNQWLIVGGLATEPKCSGS